MSEAPVKTKRKTRKEMLQGIIVESSVTERNVMTIQKQLSQSTQTACHGSFITTFNTSHTPPPTHFSFGKFTRREEILTLHDVAK
jgi:hypothetical protein